MNLPNAAQLIHYAQKGQAVNNFLMAPTKTPKNAEKRSRLTCGRTWRQSVFPRKLSGEDAAARAFRPRCKGNLAGLPGRSLERLWLGVMCSPPSLHFGAAVFALRYAPSEDWCLFITPLEPFFKDSDSSKARFTPSTYPSTLLEGCCFRSVLCS